MPSPDKLFRLDPVETKITAPVSQFQSLADAGDMSVANRSLGRGLTAFSQALGGLAQFKKQEQIRDDIKTAKDAAVRGEVMPNVLPVAETAYRNVIDINTASDSLLAIDRFENGEDFGNLVKNPELQSDQKTSQIEASYDDFYARAVQTMQNPDTIQKLRLTINGLKEKAYQKVYEHEKTVRNIEGIHGLKNTLGNAKRFAEGSGVELIDTLTPNWVQANAVDLGKSHPYLGIDERKLLAFQVLTTDEDVLGDPEIIEEIMKSNYSKGFTFRNLYEGKGDDAKELQDIYNTYVKNSKAYFEKLDADQEAADIINTDQVNADIWKQTVGAGLTSADGVAEKMIASGYFTVEKANKHEKAIQSYMNNNLKAKRGSPEYMQVLDLIQAHGITQDSQLHLLMINGAIDPSLETELKTYLTEEGKQKLAFIGKYQSQIRLLSNNVLSLSKIKLSDKGKSVLASTMGREATRAEMMSIVDGAGLDPKQVELIIQQVQDLQNGMQQLAENYGSRDSIADKADGSVPQENLEKFQSIMEANVNKLIADIDKGLEERPGTREVNLPSLEFPVISTGDEFPLVVNQTKNIFETNTKDLFHFSPNDLPVSSSNLSKTGADISSASGSITFDVAQSFMQHQNMTMRSYVLDATTKNWPKPFSDMVVAIVEQEKKDKVAEPDTPQKQAIRNHRQMRIDMDNWFSDIGEEIGMMPGFLMEVLNPSINSATGKPWEKADFTKGDPTRPSNDYLEQVKKVNPKQYDEIVAKLKNQGKSFGVKGTVENDPRITTHQQYMQGIEKRNVDKDIVDSGKNLLNLMQSIVGVSEAEGATTSQDADFDPTAPGARGFTGSASKPLAVKPEAAKGATGFPAEYGEQFVGGTSEESDIEGFIGEDIGEDVDMPPVVMDEIVVSEKAQPSALEGLPKETQKDIRRQLENERRVSVPKTTRFEKSLMDKELGAGDRSIFKGTPYVSHNFAQRQGLSGKDRKLSNTANLPTAVGGKTGLTIGFGHDVTPQELSLGKIAGITFVNKQTGNFIDLSNNELEIIFKNDLKIHEKVAKNHFNNKGFGIAFENTPEELQLFLTERAFSTGTNAMTQADDALKDALAIKNNLDRVRRDKRTAPATLKKSKAYQLEMKKLKKAVDSFIFNVKERPAIQPRVDALFKMANTKDGLYRFFKLQGK